MTTSLFPKLLRFLISLISTTTTTTLSTNSRLFATAALSSSSPTGYDRARTVRVQSGHSAAVELYRSLLSQSSHRDLTAASRIAAAYSSPSRHDNALKDYGPDDVESLRRILSNFTNANVKKLFRIVDDEHPLSFASGPVYARTAAAGCTSPPPYSDVDEDDDDDDGGLKCLVSMFILGYAVPKSTLLRTLGPSSITLFQRLGLAHECEIDSNLMVPYLQLFPLESSQNNLVFVTDWHPNVLSLSANIGTTRDGPVMYIGPDSLALVQHFIHVHCPSFEQQQRRQNDDDDNDDISILDLCCGSGIQAITALTHLSNATATCVDVNPRALRFTKFNALLNGCHDDAVTPVECDLAVLLLPLRRSSESFFLDRSSTFDIVLANPPFIPVPPTSSIVKRYGLFSSGGSSGEEVLECIVALSRSLLRPRRGMVGIVSEFMNPGLGLCAKIVQWWNATTTTTTASSISAKGILFTNQYPLSSDTYAKRRSNDESEYSIWKRHLSNSNITTVSPGLLFLMQTSSDDKRDELKIKHCIVPKCSSGSLWTPHNHEAVKFTKRIWDECVVMSNDDVF